MIELSIIVPIYNVEKYLEECLESIYKIKNIKKEVILINDGSKDKSLDIAKKFKKKYKEETILIDNENKGLSETRNIGINLAKGNYLWFIDSDDKIIPNLEQVFLKLKGNKYDVLYMNGYFFPNMLKIYENTISKDYNLGRDYLVDLIKSKKSINTGVWKNLYKTEFIKKNKIYFMKGLLHEDIPFYFEVFLKAKTVAYIDEKIYLYRINNFNSITKNISSKNIIDYYRGLDYSLDIYSQMEKNNKINSYLLSHYWYYFIKFKMIDKKILNKILKLKYFNLKGYIQIIFLIVYMYIFKFIKSDIKNIERG